MSRPTALELMAYFDGELDEARAAEVAAFLAQDEGGAETLTQLTTLGDHVRGATVGRGAEVDVADDVMAAIERVETAAKNAASMPPPPVRRSTRPPAKARPMRLAPAAMGVMLAVAAAFALWWRAELPAVSTGQIASLHLPTPDVPVDDDRHAGAEIDAVDFGNNAGAIFYVPGPSDTATAVVWIEESP
jgi:negative regulator of sigma E activity